MELAQYQDYEEYKKAMNTVLNRTVEDFVMTGYLLKQGRDTDILKDSGDRKSTRLNSSHRSQSRMPSSA